MIPESAVEAAATAIREHQMVRIAAPEGEYGSSIGFRTAEDLALLVLEAAAPFILAEAKEAGVYVSVRRIRPPSPIYPLGNIEDKRT